jgi:lysophospholipase L1-like esterase
VKLRTKLSDWAAIVVASMMISVVVLAPPSFASAPKKPISMFYVSLGDSYAAGVEAGPGTGGYTTRVVTDVAPKHKLILRNFGCGGATTTTMMSVIGCSGAFDSHHGLPYPNMTQLAAAISFIDAHRGRIGLITVTIGGNDLGGTADNVPPIATNIASISAQLRAAAGRSVPIIGLTYPDADLADWLSGPSGVTIAEESVTAFQQVVNPDWKAAYATANVTFVDITAASGAYTPLTQLVSYSTYGEIPYAVAQVCILTGMCSESNVHPTDAGETLIANQIVHAYLRLLI